MGTKEKLRRKKERQKKDRQKQLDMKKQEFRQRVKSRQPKPPVLRNALAAFLAGGAVSIIGQFILTIYSSVFNFTPEEAGNPTVATVIFISSLLTGIGVYDDLAKHVGAGLAVPVTGFANSMTSAALEFKREGLVLGVGSRMFSLAGSVIVFGVVTAFIVGIISALS